MKSNPIFPQDQVFWYLNKKKPEQLRRNVKADVVVVGGGIAGLSAAQSFHEKGYSVVLLEKNYCGAGASGKSSGFITPESELNVSHLIRLVGAEETKKLWDFVNTGVSFMEENIKKFSLDCDYQVQDCLIVASAEKDFAAIKKEHEARTQLSYKSILYTQETLPSVIGSNDYYGAYRYPETFGINAYRYCQGIKDALMQSGVTIFEETPVIKIHARGVDTDHATVEADQIIVCVDRFAPSLEILIDEVYPAQTFLMISSPLPDEAIKKIFPQENLMVWDTDLIYQYFRVTGDNRLMVGGSDLLGIFQGKEHHNSTRMFKKLSSYIKHKFPGVPVTFEYFWPGLIGVSKDVVPLAGRSQTQPNVYSISGVAGLPWAAALGCYSAANIVDNRHDLDNYFSPERKFPIGKCLGRVLGKRITFSLSNLKALY